MRWLQDFSNISIQFVIEVALAVATARAASRHTGRLCYRTAPQRTISMEVAAPLEAL
jgi:hypothetical protein